MAKKKLLLVGAGHAHVEVLRRYRTSPPPNTCVTLISETDRAGYSGMMPGVLAGHYRREQAEIDVPALCAGAGVRYVRAGLQRIIAAENRIETDHGAYDYDFASLNLGSQPWRPAVASPMHLPIKPFAALIDAFEAWDATAPMRPQIVVIGAGAAAVEVLLALHYRYRALDPRCTLICSPTEILPGYPRGVVERARHALDTCGAKIVFGAKATQASEGAVHINPGNVALPCDLAVWATGPRPIAALAVSDLALAGDGFIAVDAMQRSVSHTNVFAVGDCASRSDITLQKSGVIPVRQGPWLAQQIRAAIAGDALTPFENASTALALLALGKKTAVGNKGNAVFSGAWVWHWKDWIDRRFMAKYAVAGEPD